MRLSPISPARTVRAAAVLARYEATEIAARPAGRWVYDIDMYARHRGASAEVRG